MLESWVSYSLSQEVSACLRLAVFDIARKEIVSTTTSEPHPRVLQHPSELAVNRRMHPRYEVALNLQLHNVLSRHWIGNAKYINYGCTRDCEDDERSAADMTAILTSVINEPVESSYAHTVL